MRRRQFLGLMAALAAAGGAAPAARQALSADTRGQWWDPSPAPNFPIPNNLPATVLEWRYLAGRITEGAQDYGFVVSIANYNWPLNDPPQLLVMRKDFVSGAHATRTYPCKPAYDPATATYTFTATEDAAIKAIWRLDTVAQTYTLSVTSPELTLENLTLVPVGQLIAEGGDGRITTARLAGMDVLSDYHADWLEIRRGATRLGYGRLDMQTIDPAGIPSGGSTGFSHHWFSVAAETATGPVWVSAWRLISQVTTWVATVARGTGAGWSVETITEETPGVAFPVTVGILGWQDLPAASGQPTRRTGRAWRVTAGRAAAGDLIDLTISVAPGQFITGARVASGLVQVSEMQEALTLNATGRVRGQTISGVRLAVAESTFTFREAARLFLPRVVR